MRTIVNIGTALVLGIMILAIQKNIPPILPMPNAEAEILDVIEPAPPPSEKKQTRRVEKPNSSTPLRMPLCGTKEATEDAPCLTLNGVEALALMAFMASRELPRN